MVKEDRNRESAESGQTKAEIVDNGGTRSGDDRRLQNEGQLACNDRRSGKDRRRGYDRRTGLPRRRMQERRVGNRLYWNGTAVERRDAFRKG